VAMDMGEDVTANVRTIRSVPLSMHAVAGMPTFSK